MKLAIINGSPRNKKSNSKILIEQFLQGFNSVCRDEIPVHYLASAKTKGQATELIAKSDLIIIIFPLYTDCMPGIVKEFFEEISLLNTNSGKKIGFIVQSGFPESVHSIALSRYLEKLVRRLKMEYMGTIIKGGVEGIQIMAPVMTRKLFNQFYELGVYFATNSAFDPELAEKMRTPLRLSARRIAGFKLLSKTGITNFYWNSALKKNGAYPKRFARPYAD